MKTIAERFVAAQKPTRTFKLVRKPETHEWVVKVYVGGKYDEEQTYYTDDKQDAVDTMERMKKKGQAERQFGPGDDIFLDKGDRIMTSYGKLWVVNTGVVGGIWTSTDRNDIELGRGRSVREAYVSAIQKGGVGPWYPVRHERGTDAYVVHPQANEITDYDVERVQKPFGYDVSR